MTAGTNSGRIRRRSVAVLVAGAMGIATLTGLGWFGGLRINLTPSEPVGLWRIVPIHRAVAIGDLVFICPPPGTILAFGLGRGYFRWGSCRGGVAPLLKTVAALSGARLDVDAEVKVDGVVLPRSKLSAHDGIGRPLIPWSGGVVPAGQIFLHSPFAGSYDSRYFGPIPDAGLLGLAQPVFTFDP